MHSLKLSLLVYWDGDTYGKDCIWYTEEGNAEVRTMPQVFEKFGGSSNYKNCGTGWLFLRAINGNRLRQ